MDLFVINLPDSRKRLLLLQESLNSLGIPFSVHNAAKGSSLLRADYPGSDSLREGELGCAVSHYQLYEKFAERPERIFCILEDDVRPSQTLKQVLGHFEANPPPDGVVVLLNAAFTHLHFIEITTILSSKLKIGVIQELPGGLGSTGGYILSSKTAASLASARKVDWSFAADSWTNYYRSSALKEIWVVLPYPAPPSFRSESTIGYVPNKPGLIQFVKGWRLFDLLRNFNRRRVWMSKQIPKRIVSNAQGGQYFTKAKGFLEFKKTL